MKQIFKFFVVLFIGIGGFLLLSKSNKYDFIAQSPTADNVSLKNFANEYKVVYFGYLFCPDVCPATLSVVGESLNKIGNKDIKLIFITLDPDRDSSKELTQMAKAFYPNSIGLKVKDLPKITKAYGAKYKKIPMPDSAMKYSVAHSSAIYLLDKNNKFFAEVTNLTREEIEENILNMIKDRP